LSSKYKKVATPPESLREDPMGKIPYHFVICKIKGCVRMHDDYYPVCSKHRKEEKDS